MDEKESKAIHGILLKILDKWRTDIQGKAKETLEETFVLSPDASQRGTSPSRATETEDVLEKTVILSPQELGRREEPPPAPRSEEISETVILTPKRMNREAQSPITGPSGEEKISTVPKSTEDQYSEETVILKPGKGKANG